MTYNTKDIDALANFLDTKYKTPFGIRIGWDGLLGLIPGIGDTITSFLSLYILIRAGAIGCSPPILIRMGLNILIDTALSAIPIFGNIADFFWKSNDRNVRLIHSYLRNKTSTSRSSTVLVATIAILFVIIIGFVVYMAFQIAFILWHYIIQLLQLT